MQDINLSTYYNQQEYYQIANVFGINDCSKVSIASKKRTQYGHACMYLIGDTNLRHDKGLRRVGISSPCNDPQQIHCFYWLRRSRAPYLALVVIFKLRAKFR